MWSQVHWEDGRHEDCEEDYGPEWYVVAEFENGHFTTWDPETDEEVEFDAAPVTGAEGELLWTRLQHGVEPHDRA